MLKQLPGRRPPIRTAIGLTAVLGSLMLAGCSAGQDAQTVGQRPPIDGVSASVGAISVRAAGVLAPESGSNYAKGASAQLQLVLINNGASADTLTSVSSPAASGAQVSNSGGSASSVVSASGSASASDSASASGSASATSSAPASEPITLPAGQSVQIGFTDSGPTVSLTDLTVALYPAQSLPVTLTFGSGASVTVTMPVKLVSQAPSAPVISEATAPSGE